MIAAAAATICGEVRTVGSSGPDLRTVLFDGSNMIALGGDLGSELTAYSGRVCISGSEAAPQPGIGRRIIVKSYRLIGDGKHAPIVGIIRARGRQYFIETRDRRRLRVIAQDTTTLPSVVDRLVWMTASWSDSALQLIRIGPLGATN